MTELSLLPAAWVYGFAALFGLMCGSFFNVVIARLPKMMELAWQRECQAQQGNPVAASTGYNLAIPASHCPSCTTPIAAKDNIPLLSYLLLRGKCRHCAAPVSIRYPIIELASAALILASLAWFGLTLEALAYTLLLWGLLILSTIDLAHMLLPDQLTLPLLWLGLLGSISILPITPTQSILGAIIGYGFLWSLFWVFKLLTGKEGLGYGDFKLLAALGAWLGWQQLPLVILLASFTGAVLGIIMIIAGNKERNMPIPFGPFLAFGGVLGLFWGEHLYQWYWQWAGLV